MEKTSPRGNLLQNQQIINENSMIEKKKYDLVFIGGGPSTIAFLSYLFQKKYADKVFSSTNILVIEKSEYFGSGCLGQYGINTNTSSEGFPRLICYTENKDSKEKAGKFALSPSKNAMKLSKNYNNANTANEMKNKNTKIEKALEIENNGKLFFRKIPLFIDLYQSSAVQTLLTIGNRPAPLSLVGYFLDCLGNFTVNHINKVYGKNILLNRAEVKSVKCYNNEEYGVIVKRDNNTNLIIKSKCVIFATGGKQSVEHPYYKLILSSKGEDRVFTSDYILREQGYRSIISKLKESTGKKRVVIIGGSHSGFSCAWILLNEPAAYSKIKKGEDYQIKTDLSCSKCINTYSCTCFGKVSDRNWNLEDNLANFPEDELEICILYRDHIKVYYPTEEEAKMDNYTIYNPKEALNKQGRVYPFIGIRGDAKELYNKIIRNEEKRVSLIQAQTNQEQSQFIKNADVVIWACGYITNSIPVYDTKNNPIEFITDEVGTIEVDKQLHLLPKGKVSLRNIYGIGQGYSTKAPEVINGKKARADSIHIYNTHIASKLYKTLEYFLNKLAIENLNKLSSQLILKRKSEAHTAEINNYKKKNTNLFKTGKNNGSNKENFNEKVEKEYTSNDNQMENQLILPNIHPKKLFPSNKLLTKNSPKNANIQSDYNEIKVKRFSYVKDRMEYGSNVRQNILRSLSNTYNINEQNK